VPVDVLILALPNAKLTAGAKPFDRFDAGSEKVTLEIPSGRRIEVDGATSAAEREKIVRALLAAEATELRAERLQFGLTALAIWLVPCAALVIIGTASAWVYRGFKRRPHSP
jgi:hypothetical protein